MNAIDWSQETFVTVVQASGAAAILACATLLLQLVLGKRLGAGWRYLLWMPVVIRLLLPPLPETPWSLFNAPQWLTQNSGGPKVTIEFFDTLAGNRGGLEMLSESAEPFTPNQQFVTSVAQPKLNLVQMATMVWVSVAAFLILRLLGGALWLSFRLRRESGASEDLLAAFANANAELPTLLRPQVIETELVESPALFGFLTPRLLLPKEIGRKLNSSELRHVLLHELAHLKRGDLFLNWIMALAQAIHWFNPLVWLLFRRMRLERELACDEIVLAISQRDEAQVYGQTILKLLEGLPRRTNFPGMVGILEDKREAEARIRQIASYKTSNKNRKALGLGLFSMIVLIGLTNAQTPEESQATTSTPEAVQSVSNFIPVRAESTSAPSTELISTEKTSPELERLRIAQEAVKEGRFAQAEYLAEEVLKKQPESTEAKEILWNVAQGRSEREPAKKPTGRMAIIENMRRIRLDKFNLPPRTKLPDAIKALEQAVKAADPTGKGLAFIIGFSETPAASQPARSMVKTDDFEITMPHGLSADLLTVLNEMCGFSNPPAGTDPDTHLQYSIEDYAIVFAAKGPAPEPLYTRTYRVEPNIVRERLTEWAGTNSIPPLPEALFNHIKAKTTVRFETPPVRTQTPEEYQLNPLPPQKALFFNDQTGVLFVRATLKDMDQIEGVIQELNIIPHQITLETRIIALKAGDEQSTQVTLASLLPNLTEPSGILTESETSTLLSQFKELSNADLLSAPRVTTLAGRQARVSIEPGPEVDLIPYFDPEKYLITIHAILRTPYGEEPASEVELDFSGVLYDGQTLVTSRFVSNPPQKRSFLQRIFGRGKQAETKDQLILMVTPIMTDSKGFRVYPRDGGTLPFNPQIVPPQKS